MSYNIGIVGTGYVGLVTGTCFASTGNTVFCIDNDKEKVEKLKNGIIPIYEPGLEYLVNKNYSENRLKFSTDLEEAVANCLMIFLCLPTPPNEDGSADLHHLLGVAKDIAEIIKKKKISDKRILINKSTVPVGTAEKVLSLLNEIIPNNNIDVLSNPEFLREGFAVEDALKPERVVIGTTNPEEIEPIMRSLYEPFLRSGNPIYFFDIKSAELTKYASNAFLATKISFMNDLSAYCEKVEADIESVRIGMGSDSRIGKRFLFAGIGYGGSCFPKDVRALIHSADAANTPLDILKAVYSVNSKQIQLFNQKISQHFNGDLKNRKFAIWGLSFKPNTDDTRESPAFTIIEFLLEKGASLSAYDPEAMENTKKKFGNRIEYAADMYDALENADALIVPTEWGVFRRPNFAKVKELLKTHIIFDGRNIYSPEEMKEYGFNYYSIGRKS